LGEKSSATWLRDPSSQDQAIGQAQAGKGSINSIGICRAIRLIS
jgi:hypothetical protein